MTKQRQSALALAAAGYRVFPAHGKIPAFKGWQEKATTNKEQLNKWWSADPQANPAIKTGDGLVVLDVDGKEGLESLQQLEKRYGVLPATRCVETGGGGLHFYFRDDSGQQFPNSCRKLGAGLDIRGDGGLVIAPGAEHESGKTYEWDMLSVNCEAPLPNWLRERILAPDEQKGLNTSSIDSIPEGQRNDTLFKHGSFLRGQRGYTVKQLEDALRSMNTEKCDPPLKVSEIKAIVKSVCERYPREGGADAAFKDRGELSLVSFSDIPEEEPVFLFEPYIPKRGYTLLQGNPGDGKTFFVLALAALLSKGQPLIEGKAEIGNSLIVSVEDAEGYLRKRLNVMGADCNKIFTLNEKDINLDDDRLEKLIIDYAIRLVVFDPIQAFLSKIDMHRSNETRPVLARLTETAKRTDCAIILVSHMNKQFKDSPNLYRSLGSIDFPAAARSVLMLGRDSKDPETRLVVPLKGNSGILGKSISFSIGANGVDFDGYSDATDADLMTGVSKKALQASTNPFLVEGLIAACEKVLEKNPEGKLVAYGDLDFIFPDGVQPKSLIDSVQRKLAEAGLCVVAGKRTTGGLRGVLITPAQKEGL